MKKISQTEKTNEEELVPCKGIIYMSVQGGKDFYDPCPHNNKVPVGTENWGGETCIECSKENSRNYMSRDHMSGGRSVAPI